MLAQNETQTIGGKTVVITKMTTGKMTKKNFITEAEALEYFRGFCDENNLEYDNDSEEAGGIGHDFRIEIEEENENQ